MENKNMHRIAVKFVTRFLKLDQKIQCFDLCLEFHEMTKTNGKPISRTITGGEIEISSYHRYGYDPETKQ